jgi:putative ABC transport system permease protein
LTAWLIAGLRSFQLPGRVRLDDLTLGVDTSVLAASIVIAIVATLVISLVAGVFGFSANVADALRTQAGSTPALRRRWTRAGLVTTQVAVALVLVAGAALFGRSLAAALSLNSSLETERIITGSVNPGRHGYTPGRATAFFDELMTRLRVSSAIESASYSQYVGGMSANGQIEVDGEAQHPPSTVSFYRVDSRYFATIGLPLIEGRMAGEQEQDAIVVSESLGRLIARGASPVGHRLAESPGRPQKIVVGVVPDHITNVTVLEPLVLYAPLALESARSSISLTLRASLDAGAARSALHDLIRQIDPAVLPGPMSTLQEQISRQMGPQQLGASVLGALGGMALLLTVLGSYVLAESMAHARRRELGVRSALGATRSQLGGLILRDTLKLVVAGLVVGIGLAWLLAGLIRGFLFGIEPLDVPTLTAAATAILAVTIGVTLKPAITAARQNLARTLRED